MSYLSGSGSKEQKQDKQNDKKPNIRKNISWTLVSLALAVLTVRMVIKQSSSISAGELFSIIASSNKLFFLTAVICSALFVWAEGIAIGIILKFAGYPRRRRQNLIYSTSDIYFSGITPSATGGQPASAFFMMRDGIPGGVATAALVLNLMMYTISIIVLGLFSIFVSPGAFFGFGRFSRLLIAAGFIGLIGLSAAFLLILKKGSIVFGLLSKCVTMLYNRKIIGEKDRKIRRLEKIRKDYESCSELIAGRKKVPFYTLLWNIIQRSFQMVVPSILYLSLGGEPGKAPVIFARQCLITIGYNFVPIPGGMGISDYLMVDGFSGIMGTQTAYRVELLSRGITFYICVSLCGVITLAGYLMAGNRRAAGSRSGGED